MSILSSPQGTPERVYALLSTKRVLETATHEELNQMLNPGVRTNGEERRVQPAVVDNIFGAARSLGYDDTSLKEPVSYMQWSDEVHDQLAGLPEDDLDAVLLRAFAWAVVESDRHRHIGWFIGGKADELSDAISAGLRINAGDQPAMNSTKLTAWRRWMMLLGLLARVPVSSMREVPIPTRRLARELERGGFKPGEKVEADDFVARVASRMPYLDGGALFAAAADKMGHRRSPTSLSPPFSLALQELHDRNVIQLRAMGDQSKAMRLSGDATHLLSSFHFVEIGSL